MKFYYAGFNVGPVFGGKQDAVVAVDAFTEVLVNGLMGIEIGWSYLLLWKEDRLYIASSEGDNGLSLLEVPGEVSERCKIAAAGKDFVVVLTVNNDIWRYKMLEKSWRKVPNFITSQEDTKEEYPVKIVERGCTAVLTNLGRVFMVPMETKGPKGTKFTDVALGFNHTILLADNGDVYSMGMGLRGQLGHDDLEDCDDPEIIRALAGIKVVQIAAGGWHSAVVTDQGDLYTWGWNTEGELGLVNACQVVATPTVVEFRDEDGEDIEVSVKRVQCGNNFTICMTEDGQLWGSGSNKYGQLGRCRKSFPKSAVFVKLDVPLNSITDFRCNEWGTILVAH